MHVDLDDGLHAGDVGSREPHTEGGVEDLLHNDVRDDSGDQVAHVDLSVGGWRSIEDNVEDKPEDKLESLLSSLGLFDDASTPSKPHLPLCLRRCGPRRHRLLLQDHLTRQQLLLLPQTLQQGKG